MPIYRTAVRHDYAPSGGPGYNIWHFRSTTSLGPQSPTLEAAAEALRTFYTGIRPLFPPQSTHTWDGQWSGVDEDEYLPPYAPWVVAGTNTEVAGYAPTSAAMCVTWRTASNTPSGRGRTFLSPLSRGVQQDNGTPDPEALTFLRNAVAALVAAYSGEGPSSEGAFGVYSRSQAVIRDFVAGSVTDQFAVLRSRRD